ncbi:helix-turn-helix domain-containing protein [Oceanobacillus sp. J11TS1]|uniref:helix-turn-helix domain-containing protein n=1 Tax=Oceanobacillus sp. J11TS1 TaxID=2807191 RepID=UPI001FD12CDA|nr:helix-turn-helix domain-containing protein [Oceanobacillus sp. J11TS1]
MGLKEIISRAEKQAIIHAIQKSNGDKIKAADLLGISKSSFYEKIKRYDLSQ